MLELNMNDGKPRVRAPELMDSVELGLDETGRALDDLERINLWTLGLGAARRVLQERQTTGGRAQMLLDIGTGSGQVSSVLVRDSHKRGIELRAIGLDCKLCHLVIGRRRGHRQLRVVADAEHLPFRSGAVDWSLSNLFFHHFDGPENRNILSEMRRVCRRAAVVVDLRQSRAARLIARILLPLLGAGRVALHDGWLSADQAWNLEQVREIADEVGTTDLRRRFPFRFSLVMEAAEPDPTTPED
jgi:ubiquinone/menaquinone biosynthesis C-methylase UbiE